MEINFNSIKELMKSKNYIATDKLVWDTIKSIKRIQEGNQKGQDLYSICLEGPPGAGKSFYVKTYKKILKEVFNEDIEMVEYSCDSTTGKTDLYEDIRVSAAITGNPEDVIISGKLVEAIEKVNTGKKVIILLDEFEKSRRETDSFMFQFLQDGKVITSQKGTLEIKPEYKKNLQVFLCKNDERELSPPLLRRNHIIRLETMKPEDFHETIKINLPDSDEDIVNVVSLLYEKMYGKMDEFAKFPSCSEGLLAIQDACTLLEMDAPAEVIYADILSNMLKHPDDIETFMSLFKKDKQLKNLCNSLLQNIPSKNNPLREEIYRSFFSEEIQKISDMKIEYETKEKGLEDEKKEYEKKRKEHEEEIEKLKQAIRDFKQENPSGQIPKIMEEKKVDIPDDLSFSIPVIDEVSKMRFEYNTCTRNN